MYSLLLGLTLALPLTAAGHGLGGHKDGHHDNTSTCAAPNQAYSMYCCHGQLVGPSVTKSNSSAAMTTGSAAASTGGLSGVITNGLPTSLSAHVPVPIHSTDAAANEARSIPAAIDSKVSKITGNHHSETSIAPGVTCRGTVQTMGSNGTMTSGAAATTKAAATTSVGGIGVSSGSASASSASTQSSATSKGAAAPANTMAFGSWVVGMGAAMGILL